MIKVWTILCLSFTLGYGMDCSYGTSDNALDKFIQSCPKPIINAPEDEYCCYNGDKLSCCDLSNYITNMLTRIWPIIVLVLIVCIVLSCICCCLRQIRSLCC